MGLANLITRFAASVAQTMRSGFVSATRLRPSALVNGLAAGVGIAIAASFGAYAAPSHVSSVLLGALCVSIADSVSAPGEKFRRLLFAWVASCLALLAAGSAQNQPLVEAAVVAAGGFCAAMVTAFGRTAIALSVAILIVLALAGSADPPGLAAPIATFWFACGGLLYFAYAVLVTPLLTASAKRMLLREALLALAAYLRAQNASLEPGADSRRAFALLIDSQAALAERIQAARDVVFVGVKNRRDRQEAAQLVIAIDILEAALAEQADLDALLDPGERGEQARTAMRALLSIGARELDRLARLSAGAAAVDLETPPAERRALLEQIAAAVAEPGATSAPALRATRNKLETLFIEIDRLAKMRSQPEHAGAVIAPLDLAPFVQRSIFDLRNIRRELNLRSPVMRFAVRLSLAMLCGSLIGEALPYRAHGSWILLTVALVMRANYSVTRRRRDERLLGNMIGCIVSAALLSVAPGWIAPILVFIAVACSHAFALQSYLVSSIASCVMALMLIRSAQPNEGVFFIMRFIDTGIGAAIAYAFSFFLPYWEYQTVAKLRSDLIAAELECARQALRVQPSDHAYRLARRRLFEAIAALSTAVSRMLEEPASTHSDVRALSEFLAAGYAFAAELASVQVFVRNRADPNERQLPAALERALQYVEDSFARAGSAYASEQTSDRPTSPPGDALIGQERLALFARRLNSVTEVAERINRLAGKTAAREEAPLAAV